MQVTLEALCSGQGRALDVAIVYAQRQERTLRKRVEGLEQVGVIHNPGPGSDIFQVNFYHLSCCAGYVERLLISSHRTLDNYRGSKATWEIGSSRTVPSEVEILLRHSW